MRGLSEQRAVVYPCVRERYEAAKKCGFSDEQNPYHESKYEALTAPVPWNPPFGMFFLGPCSRDSVSVGCSKWQNRGFRFSLIL